LKLYTYKITRQFVREVKTVTINTCKAAAEAARTAIDFDRDQEHLVVIFLNSKNDIKGVQLVTLGTLDCSLAHPREIFRAAIVAGGVAGIIIAHNHPSGNVKPSAADFAITKKVKEAGDIIGIKLLDSIIVSEDTYHSMKKEGEPGL
jgi:DNA repair protein RadC